MKNLALVRIEAKEKPKPKSRSKATKCSSPFFFSEISVVACTPQNRANPENRQPTIRIRHSSPKEALSAKAQSYGEQALLEKESEFLLKTSERAFGSDASLALFVFAHVKGSEKMGEAIKQYEAGCSDFSEIEFLSLSHKLSALFGFVENKSLARFELRSRGKAVAWLEREWPFELKFREGGRVQKKAQQASEFVLGSRPTMADFLAYLEFRFAWKFHRKLSQDSPEVGFELGAGEQKLLGQAKKRLEDQQSAAIAAQDAIVREFKEEFERIRLQFGIERGQLLLR